MQSWKSQSYKAAFEHARLLTAHHAKSFYLATNLLPEEKKWATFAVYGFCRFADNMIDSPRDRDVTEVIAEVDSLEHELAVAYRTGESEHPIIRPFILVAKQYGIPAEYPMDLLEGVKMDLNRTRYETFDELYVFCYRVASVVGLMMTHVLGYSDDRAFFHAEKLGVAMQLTNILRDVKEDAELGRIYLPRKEMEQYGVSEEDVLSGRFTDDMQRLMEFQVRRARDYYTVADPGIPMLNRDARFAVSGAARMYGGILQQLERRACNPFEGRVFVSKPKKLTMLMSEWVRTRFELPSLSQSPEPVDAA